MLSRIRRLNACCSWKTLPPIPLIETEAKQHNSTSVLSKVLSVGVTYGSGEGGRRGGREEREREREGDGKEGREGGRKREGDRKGGSEEGKGDRDESLYALKQCLCVRVYVGGGGSVLCVLPQYSIDLSPQIFRSTQELFSPAYLRPSVVLIVIWFTFSFG